MAVGCKSFKMADDGLSVTIRTYPCPECRQDTFFQVSMSDWQRYEDGAFVQVAFPNVSSDMRERLVSGICPKCWDKMF